MNYTFEVIMPPNAEKIRITLPSKDEVQAYEDLYNLLYKLYKFRVFLMERAMIVAVSPEPKNPLEAS